MSISDSFTQLINERFITMGGVLVEIKVNGFKVFGKDVKTLAEVRDRISEAREALNKSIKIV